MVEELTWVMTRVLVILLLDSTVIVILLLGCDDYFDVYFLLCDML